MPSKLRKFILLVLVSFSSPSFAKEGEVEIFGGLGISSFTNIGLSYYLEEGRQFGVRFQAGTGQLDGAVAYKDEYNLAHFFWKYSSGETDQENEWEKFIGVGIGQRNFNISTNFTDNLGAQFVEQEEIKQIYLNLNFSALVFQSNRFVYGTDFSLNIPFSNSAKYFANDNARGIATSAYQPTHRDFQLLKNLFAAGISFQINLFRFGWYF